MSEPAVKRDDEPRTALRRSSRAPLVLAGVAVAALAGFAVLRLRAPDAPPPPPPAPPAAPADAAQGAAAPGDAAGDTGPEVDPKQIPALVEGVSSNPLFRRAIAGDDLVRRLAVVVENLAEGVSPRRALAALAPDRPFTVVRQGDRTLIDPASYARYDAFADAVASVDAPAVARVYRAIHRPLQAAYRALGYPGASLDAALARALHRLEAAPVAAGEVEVRDEGGIWVFEQARLEGQREVEKHLLRMGPRNARLVQQKARELADALGLPPAAAAGAPAR